MRQCCVSRTVSFLSFLSFLSFSVCLNACSEDLGIGAAVSGEATGSGLSLSDTGLESGGSVSGGGDEPSQGSDSETAPGSGGVGPTTSEGDGASEETETATGDEPSQGEPFEIEVTVRLDGVPTAGIVVQQGGVLRRYLTGDQGRVVATVERMEGDLVLHGSHPDARIGKAFVSPSGAIEVTIELRSFDRSDNEEYVFFPPGTPADELYCSHCHKTMNHAWYDSPHRTSASNPTVQDLYAGVVTAVGDAESCADAGGQWWQGLEPGTGDAVLRCYLGAGVLPDLNPGCGDTASCDDVAVAYGGCADCHAPAINGELGGRDLLEARGIEHEFGVHCDLCHKVESVDLQAPPGVGGRLAIVRPSEWNGVPGEPWKTLSFGPFHDVSQVKMGAVQRDHFTTAEFCAGCHQQDVAVEALWGTIDLERWPAGVLPVQSTYEEWIASPMNPGAPCQTCHMAPDFSVLNSADLQDLDQTGPGMIAGWARPGGAVRQHAWVGPRAVDSGMLELAASLSLTKTVVGDEVSAEVRVSNVGAGHALPTGEAMRSIVLLVEATCGDSSLVAIAGAAVPGFGGFLDRKPAPEDWSIWPGARVGDVVRVVAWSGEWYDYEGFGPFGDGTFGPQQKGMPVESVVGESVIVAMDGDEAIFDTPLPAGEVAYRGETIASLAGLGGPAVAVAGAAGFGFSRVLSAADGSRGVPHFRAVDVVSDNRLLPQRSWVSEHRFRSTCEEPEVRAVLLYRAYPLALASERRWTLDNRVMAEVWR